MHVHRQLMQTQPFKLGWSRARFINQATSSYSLSLSLCVCLSLSVSRTWFKRRERIAIHLFIPFHHHVLAIHMLLADLSLKTYYNCSTCWHKYDTLWLWHCAFRQKITSTWPSPFFKTLLALDTYTCEWWPWQSPFLNSIYISIMVGQRDPPATGKTMFKVLPLYILFMCIFMRAYDTLNVNVMLLFASHHGLW
jgi:hypothetical protein